MTFSRSSKLKQIRNPKWEPMARKDLKMKIFRFFSDVGPHNDLLVDIFGRSKIFK